jgi:hypothetical protein
MKKLWATIFKSGEPLYDITRTSHLFMQERWAIRFKSGEPLTHSQATNH